MAAPLLLQIGGCGQISVHHQPSVRQPAFQAQCEKKTVDAERPGDHAGTAAGQSGKSCLPVSLGPESMNGAIRIVTVKNGYGNRMVDRRGILKDDAGAANEGFDT